MYVFISSDNCSLYFYQTGGDTEGHRGFAIYRQGIFLFGLVSTGTQYWEASVAGAVPDNKWTNVGISWTESLGVEVSLAE